MYGYLNIIVAECLYVWALLLVGSSQSQPRAILVPELQTHALGSPHIPAVSSQPQQVQNQAAFSKDVSNEQLALWLSHHPNLIGTDFSEDIDKLRSTNLFFYTILNNG